MLDLAGYLLLQVEFEFRVLRKIKIRKMTMMVQEKSSFHQRTQLIFRIKTINLKQKLTSKYHLIILKISLDHRKRKARTKMKKMKREWKRSVQKQ